MHEYSAETHNHDRYKGGNDMTQATYAPAMIGGGGIGDGLGFGGGGFVLGALLGGNLFDRNRGFGCGDCVPGSVAINQLSNQMSSFQTDVQEQVRSAAFSGKLDSLGNQVAAVGQLVDHEGERTRSLVTAQFTNTNNLITNNRIEDLMAENALLSSKVTALETQAVVGAETRAAIKDALECYNVKLANMEDKFQSGINAIGSIIQQKFENTQVVTQP